MNLTMVHFVAGLLVLAAVLKQGLTQGPTPTTCYSDQNFGCVDSAVDIEEVPTGDDCCNGGFLNYQLFGSDLCQACGSNAICHVAGSDCTNFSARIFIGSVHDCCLVIPGGGSHFGHDRECTPCGAQDFFCFSQQRCRIREYSRPPTNTSISDCCEGTGSSYAFNERCHECVVFGWMMETLEGPESATSYNLSLGYIKGDSGPVEVSLTAVSGTAVAGRDFTLGVSSVTVSAGSPATVSLNFLEDRVALEGIESATLQLNYPEGSLPSGAIIKRNVRLSITDTDEVAIGFAEDSYTGTEADSSIGMVITKTNRIGSPVTVEVQSYTVAGAEAAGVTLPPNIPPNDNPSSPNRARVSPEDRRDFSPAPFSFTLQPDDSADEVTNGTVSVPIEDDDINEASEVFVTVFTVTSPASGVGTTRTSALARIQDNDDIRIGFNRTMYTVVEPSSDSGLGEVVLTKEDGRVSEQTFSVLVNVSEAFPNPATQDEDYRLGSSVNPFVVSFPPDSQTISLPITLLADTLPELNERFMISSSPSTSTPGEVLPGFVVPEYSPPVSLFASTLVVVADNDPMTIGFDELGPFAENVGMFNACVRVFNIDDSQPMPFIIPLLANSIAGSANESDYVRVGPDLPLLLNNERRRDCFPVQIIDDTTFEGNEMFTLTVALDTSRTHTMRDVQDQFFSIAVTILANDDMCPDLEPPLNGSISFSPDTAGPFSEVGTIATYSCDEGFQLNGSPTRECLSGTEWTGSAPTCELQLCPDLDDLPNGAISYSPDNGGPFRDIGTTATHSCDEGFFLMGAVTRVCVEGGMFNGMAPTCERLCPDLDDLPNGAISYSPDNGGPFRDIGTTATHSCDEGFFLMGVETRVCVEGGMFNGTAPTCERLCPDLDDLFNGTISYSPDNGGPFRDIGTTATHSCDEGFFLVGAETRVCVEGGVFDGVEPTCEPIVCGELPGIANGMISYSSEGPEFDIGTVANYTCNDGFMLVGSAQRTCEISGNFSGVEPLCSMIPVCQDLPPLENGVIVYSSDESPRPVGTVATHRCNSGFMLVGVVNRTCEESGRFSGTAPTCEALCPDLAPLPNGAISYSPDNGGPFRDIGTTATHNCDEGFFLMGVETRVCVEGGMFNGTAPTCASLCPDLDDLPNGAISYSPDNGGPFRDIGTTATHSCDEGFFLMGAVTRVCVDGGMFNGIAPTCEPIVCGELLGIANGVISYSSEGPEFDIGTVATYTCNDGFMLVGSAQRTCEISGNFSGVEPLCSMIPVCQDLPPLENGVIVYSSDESPRPVGTVATHRCNSGFMLVGVVNRTCEESGQFSGAAPTCEAVCPDLPPLPNGAISYSPDNGGPFRDIGTTATHSCDEGFILMGAATRVCVEGGRFDGTAPTCGSGVVRRVNDTAAGDPVMTVPLYVSNRSAISQVGEDELINLCFEVHGEHGSYFNLVSDRCVTVNAHYSQADPRLGFNIISEITVLAPDHRAACRNISVSASGCQARVDGVLLNSSYVRDGISVRLYRNRVRVNVPNCQDLDLVMWVFCETGQFTGDPDFSEPEVTVVVPAIRFVIARGFNLNESSHGILGQFWNVPIDVERYTGELEDGSTRSDAYLITVNYPGQSPRQFLSMFDSPVWDAQSGGYCLYAGNRQGGSISELLSPNDSVIEGWYTDYIVDGAFEFEFVYSHFDPQVCGG